jgi:hypothetical protein
MGGIAIVSPSTVSVRKTISNSASIGGGSTGNQSSAHEPVDWYVGAGIVRSRFTGYVQDQPLPLICLPL